MRTPPALYVAGISDCFGGAISALFFLLFPLFVPETCSWWEAAGLHGEDAGPAGCQHAQLDPSPQRQLPLAAVGPFNHQGRLAGLPEVPNSSPSNIYLHECPPPINVECF